MACDLRVLACLFTLAVGVAPPVVVPPVVRPAVLPSAGVMSSSQASQYHAAFETAPMPELGAASRLRGQPPMAPTRTSPGQADVVEVFRKTQRFSDEPPQTDVWSSVESQSAEVRPATGKVGHPETHVYAAAALVPSWTAPLGAFLLAALSAVAAGLWWRRDSKAWGVHQRATEMTAFDSASSLALSGQPKFAVAAHASELHSAVAAARRVDAIAQPRGLAGQAVCLANAAVPSGSASLANAGRRRSGVSVAAEAAVEPAAPDEAVVFDPKLEPGVTLPLMYFDPAGFAKPGDREGFRNLRAAELKHGRVAMLAALGAIVQHGIKFPGFEEVPAGIKAVITPPGTYGFVVLVALCGGMELAVWKQDPDKEPGDFGDPLGLNQYYEEWRNRELNNGRMAMFSVLGIIAAELVTGYDGVEQIFKPVGNIPVE